MRIAALVLIVAAALTTCCECFTHAAPVGLPGDVNSDGPQGNTATEPTGRKIGGDDVTIATRKERGTQGVPAKSPAESLSTIKVHDGLRVELVASEPMIADPVAIDFGADGKVWVVEMRDYGCQRGETCPPRGRVTVLEDRDANGTFETSTVFLDKIAQPMGVKVWRKGVLISAAPDLIYAEDSNGDGKADVVRKVLTGFSTENEQARLNVLTPGLDGWLHGGCVFVGDIRNSTGRKFAIGNRDFRLQPDRGEIEGETGQVQHSRVRDDWGNWFGTENNILCIHTPIADRYLRRNPRIMPPPLEVRVASTAAAQLLPRGKLVLFPLSGPAGKATAACGMTIYRDDYLGAQFSGNSFTCEPVHQLVHRMNLEPSGATFRGERADGEAETEFLSSTDNWFRPVQARTGPDGALWIVDMYRYVIEEAHYIPKEILDELDIYAGNTLGRIYRVLPKDQRSRPLPRLDRLSTRELAAAMDTTNGTLRDMVQELLLWRGDGAATEPLSRIVAASSRPAARVQALWTLELLGKLQDQQLEKSLHDSHAGVRQNAIRLAEARFTSSPELLSAAWQLADDSDAGVALQLACSLGETNERRKFAVLAAILNRYPSDVYIATGVMTSVGDAELAAFLPLVLGRANKLPPALVNRFMELAGASSNREATAIALDFVTERFSNTTPSTFGALESLLTGLKRNPEKDILLTDEVVGRLQHFSKACLVVADDPNEKVTTRAACIRIVGRTPRSDDSQANFIAQFLSAAYDSQLQIAAVTALAEQSRPHVADVLLTAWRTLTPAVRTRVLDVLLTRKQWVTALLAACEAKTIAAVEIDAVHRDRLTSYPDADIHRRAVAVFSAGSVERTAAIARYQALLKKGDFERGKVVFQKNCSMCHRVHDMGVGVGPDIAARQDKSNEGLLREILDPNRAVDQRYANYVATTVEGVVKSGILVEETSTAITLRGQQSEDAKLLRSELESLTSTGKSLMPEGLENQITPDEMSDLIAFLAAP